MADKKQESHPQDSAQGPILVPVDFSSHSEAALLLASDFADGLGARLVVLHVVHDPQKMPGYYARMASKKTLTRIADIAAEMLDEFMAKVRKSTPSGKHCTAQKSCW
jgi:nucleotide-binding universal stress UspA family protein